MEQKSFSGRISFIVLIVTFAIIVWGIISFFTPHETLTQNPQDDSFFKTTSLDTHPDVKDAVVKTIVLTTQKNPGDENSPLRFANGESNPAISIRPGEIQRWRIVNNSDSDFFNFSIPGLTFYVVARDGNVTTIPLAFAAELLAPHDSIEILVQGPGWGSYDVVSKPFQGSETGDTFMILKSESFPVFSANLPVSLAPNYDLRNAKVSNYKTYTIRENEELVTIAPAEKTVEEWTVINPTNIYYPFTLKGGVFQIIEINGAPVERYGYDKTFAIPGGEEIKIRVQ